MTYPPKIFNIDDFKIAIKVATEIKFANIMYIKNGKVNVIYAPVIVNKTNDPYTIEGHLLCNNPIFELLKSSSTNLPCTIIFNAADGYISPSVYQEKMISGKAVPTWNYVATQFDGSIEQTKSDELLEILIRQISEYEAMVGSTWQLAHAPDEYIAKLKQVILGFKFHIDNFSVTAKMSQNKSEVDINNLLQWYQQKDARRKDLEYWHDFFQGYT